MRTDGQEFVEILRSLAQVQDRSVVRAELANARPEDIAEAFQRLEDEESIRLLQLLDSETAAYVLVELPTETTRRYVSELPDNTLAHYLDILPMDDAVDLRDDLGADRYDALLEVIPKEDASEIRRLLAYPEGSVGRIMTERFFDVPPEHTVSQLLDDIRGATDEKYETINDVYVLDEGRHLLGVFSLRKAIRAAPTTTARELMRADMVTCSTAEPEEDAARTMARYGFYALPVLDDRGRMVGLFTGDDAQTILREAETEDVLALGAVSGNVEAYLSLSTWQLVKRRLPWLVILFVAEFLTGTVLRYYTTLSAESGTTTLAQLMLFVPLLIGAGGNAGSQVTTTITRSLALGEIRSRDWWLVMRREIVCAIVIGLILGLLGFMRAKLPIVGWNSTMPISLVVAVALPLIVLWAAAVSSLLPIGAKRLGFDPAVMSAPFISTFVDATGMVIYFEVARRVLSSYNIHY